MSMLLSINEISNLMKIKGRARGVVFQTDAHYVLSKKGKVGLKKLEEAIKKTDQPISYGQEVKAIHWYPLSWRVLSLITISRLFNWGEEEIIDMGEKAPKYSFIVKTLLKYFVSLEKTFSESSQYWQKHYSVGQLTTPEISLKDKRLVLCLSDFKIHPILCGYFKGYFKSLAQLVIRTPRMDIQETKCMFQGDPCHEYVINWE